jgi:lipopolysaccharide transport system permease protein
MQEENWDLEISAKKNIFSINIKELWYYRDLMMMFVKKDIITVYKQTLLGPIWFVLQPILTTLIFVILFGRIAKLSPEGVPEFAFYLISITLWSFFSETLTVTSKTFTDNASIFGKIYFPRLILPMSKVCSGFIKFLLQFGFFLVFWLYYVFVTHQIVAGWYILLTPFFLLVIVMMALGFGIVITSLTTKYRDLTFLVTFGVQLLMYATPVAYSMANSNVKKYALLLWLNPLTSVFEGFKFCFLGQGVLDMKWLAYSFVFSVFILLLGALVFNKVEKSFVDTV